MALLVAAGLSGCSEDPGLQERVNRLQAEMQEKDRQLQESQANLERTKAELKSARAAATRPPPAATPAAGPVFLPKEQVDDGYTAASKELRRRAAGELKGYTVEDCVAYPVVMPSDERPYRSKVVLLVRSEAGRSYRLEFAVSADAAGKWTFPDNADVAVALADSRTQDGSNNVATSTPAATPRNVPNNGRSPGQATPSPAPGQVPTETRIIDWGDSHPVSPASQPNRAPAPDGASPSPGRSNGSAPPADRDVRIQW